MKYGWYKYHGVKPQAIRQGDDLAKGNVDSVLAAAEGRAFRDPR